MDFFAQMPMVDYDECIEELKKGASNYSYAVKACESVLKILIGDKENESDS